MKTERKYIIVDDERRPMTFQHPQLVYAYTRSRSKVYLETYTEEEANEMIEKSIQFRTKRGFNILPYYLMPLK